ncbi:receptor-type tyrosine-protein phosphatase beta-like isoform X2 [Colossoma macropomum]|uniref:receptor-type tyrosine-protein phosphatase beta-like isoform X2 n=1 Tax=Colossoma macropomum TaxID=42526 RepID=UPI001864ED11|nr:receptor-type tyrosine-protein phosphatase beta-like isoform X2 [Colossoma macropomum]
MRRYSFRWTVHGALLGLCVLLQSFSTTVPQSTVSTSAGQTSSGTSSTNSPAASTQGNIITTSAREETSSSTDSPTTSVTIEKTSTQGSGNTTTQNVMNGTVLSSPATSAREETSSSTDSPTTSVTIEKTSTQGSGNTNLNIINLRVTDRNTSSVSLAWNLLQANSDTGTQTNGIVSTSATTTVNNLTDGGNHTSTVTAVTADGSTTGLPVQTSAVTNSEKTKSLQPGYYKVEWTNETVSTTANTSNMSYTVTSLTAGMNYTFIVTAVAADGVTVGAPAQTSAFTKPDVVTNLNVSSRSTSSVSLTWNPPQGMNSYTVEWTDVNGSNKVNVSNTTYTVTNLTAGGKYTFIVTAVAADGVTAGAPTQISAFTNPDVVTNLNISDTSTSSVSLTWDPPQGNSSSYRIKWANGSVNVSNTSYTVTSLTAGVNYTFSVTTVAADGITSGASVQTSAFTKPDIVTNLTSNSTTTSVTLTWNLRQGGSSFYTVAWTSDVLHNVNTPDTSYTVTGLTAGVNYTFTVTAVAADNVTAGSPVQISAFTKPGTVTNLTVSDRSTSSVSLTWNLPQGNNSSYTVEWTDVNGSNKVNVSNTTYTVTNLTAGGKYTFIVTAVAADGVTAGAPTQISAFTKPDIVTNLTSNSTTTSVTLTWNLRQGGSSFYTVAWTSDVPYNRNTPDTSYTVTGLTAGVNYTFTVTAVAADNVTAGSPVQISAFTKPGAVTNLTVSDRSTSSVSLTWNLPQGNSSSYTVEWTDVNGSNKVNVSNTTYTVTNLTAGGKYTFIVTAVAADGVTAGAPTQISAFTKPDAVTNLTISDSNTSSVSLTWNSPQGNSSFYRVGWTDGNMYINATTSNTSYTVTNLTPGVNYTFSVTAVAGDGVTAGALVQTSTFTNPDVVSNLNVSDKNTSSVFLIWILQHGNSFFFRVEWTGGSATTSLTSYMATNLTAGMNYTFSVTAVAADGKTTGATTQISTFTKPEIIQNLTIIGVTTSSVLLNWINPVGESSYYRVQYDSLNKTLNQTTQNTTINITDLIPGVQYMFRVFAVAADNSTEGSYGNISTYTKPEVIRNLTVTEITTTSLFINWTEPIGQRSFFKVQWTCDNETSNANTSQTFFNITNLIAGVNYYIIVSAVAADNSSEGNLISLLSYTKPDIAQNLTVVNVTTSSVLLNWIKPVGESSYYRVQYDNFNKILNQTTQNTTINITDLTPGVQYMFRVYAVAADNSTEGNYGYISTYTKPDIVQNLTVVNVTTSSVLLNWFKPVGESSYYRVQYDNFNKTLNQTTQNTTINITDLIPGAQYMFRVFAVAADNSTEGNYGYISTYTKPEVIRTLTVTEITTTSLFINWTEPIGQRSFFKVQWTCDNETSNANTSQTFFNITNLMAGVNYNLSVSAVARDNSTEGKSFGLFSVYTKPDIVQNLTVVNVTTSSVLLNWIKPVGKNSYYRIQYDNFNKTLNQTTQNTTINITDLIPGVQYMFRVFAVAADNSTEGSYGNISIYTKPDIVQNLTVIGVTTSSVLLKWINPVGESSYYRVQYDNFNKTLNQTTQNTTINITDLIPGVQYMFRVFAVAADNSTEGNYGYISTYTKPEVIRTLTVTEITTTSLFINWTEPIGQRSFFKVQWTCDNETSNANTSQTFFNITNLIAGVNYNLSVSAVARDNSTEGKSFGLFSVYTKPDIVQNLTVVNVTTSSVLLNWIKPVGKNSYYRIQYDNFNKTLNQTTQNTTINITDLIPGVQYMFRVFAVAADNSTEGSYGNISTYTKPDIIQNLTVIGVTTSSVLLNWFKPVGESSCYRVQYDNFNMTLNQTTQNTTINITDLIPGVQYMFRVFAVAADNSTEGNYGNISTYTKPDIVQKLTVVNVTTSSILLNWFKPVGESSYYRVQYDSLTKTLNRTTQNTMINITDLIPGVQYMFRVYAVAADNSTEGSYGNISSYTKPDIVQNLTVIGVTTSSVLLNWIKPVGESSYYRVQHDNFNMTLNQTTQNTTIKITDLIPGAQYMFRVFAVAADNSTEGNYGNISTYTKPEVIRNLTVPEITATSLFMNWTEPIGQRSFFKVQWTYDNETSNATTSQTFFNITNLIPGGYYYIRVSAVAADNKTEGEVVTRSPYTRPEIIRNLNAFQISTRNVSLNWTAPTGKSAFFRVLGLNESVIFNKTTKVTSFDITDLTPGLNFTFHVSAIAADNFTEGGVASLSVCTDASPVLTYSCEGPNHTDASLNITWMKPPGFCHGFNLSGTYISQNTCNRDCHHIISNLQYGMPYNVTITTLACGQSGIQNFVCTTGFTDPPVPTKPADLIFSPGSNQKRTVVQFSGSLLNGSKGEITAYGVLLSTDFDSNPNRTDLKNTYTDWTQKKSKSYLTVLKLNEKSMDRTEMIQIEIGTDETIQGTNYTNAPLEPNRYRVAVVLFTYLHISDGIVDTSLSFVSITPFATATIDIPNPLNIVGIVLGVLFFIIIILIIVIIVFIKLKRQRKKNDTGIPITTIRTKISIPVKVVDYEVYFKKQQADSNCGFAEEYEDLKVVGTAQNKSSALALENKGKNRYNNVLPYDSSRVKLSTHGSPFDDYINANYIAGYNSKKEYIAAQGPLPATVNEFWRMIWEKHVQTIVMLTKCNEQGRVKCEKYWPSGTKTYSNITVTNISEIALEDWTISDFTIRNVKTAESREVRHFHFTAWPDHGVPETTEVLINFRHLVREHMDQYSRHSPSVVHCSAGVGRTGTFIALDHLIFQIERESMVDIFGIVYDMRMHRPLMVQTEDQYVFLNQCAVDIIKSRMGTNVDLIYQNAAAFNVYGNVDQRWH